MISRLHIANYALIDSLNIEFTEGLNIITGETGAGKSIILGALGLLLGARADAKAIRRSDCKSVVEAIFNVEGLVALAAWAEENNLDWDARECILRREITPSGRSRAFVNDTPVNLTQLAELGSQLIDIHSQNQNRLLASPDYQLKIVDSIADNAALLGRYQSDYSAWRKAVRALDAAQKALEQNRADQEFIAFRLAQLDEAQLVAGEQEELENERELQSNMTEIKQLLTEALDSLTNGESSVLANLSQAVEATEGLSEVLEDATELARRLDSARLEIQDITETLSDYDSNLGADPSALEQIEERLSDLYSLERRHGVETVEQLIQIREDLRSRLEAIDNGDMAIDELRRAAEVALKAATATAAKLSARRREAAMTFADELIEVARPLGMPNLRCEVAIEPLKALSPSGADALEFRFAFNKNQQPQTVGGSASGGEVSRLMLSIKSIVAGRLQLPSIVFDEVDTGVSGDVANRMGAMMLNISKKLQVITITHLPQVAARGVSHYKVFKEDDSEATHTRIRRLGADERRGELALMLSGSSTDAAALANADSLLNK
ncbi:MAG: DNA repair protein RecN [Muribaculaceae bacterium]|nr:DNA repair protein RecN [Muribaculaceae bacterium]